MINGFGSDKYKEVRENRIKIRKSSDKWIFCLGCYNRSVNKLFDVCIGTNVITLCDKCVNHIKELIEEKKGG
jgi:hypothetical protein